MKQPRILGTMHHADWDKAGREEREFWIDMRHGLLMQVEAIEKRYLPDKREESIAAREWLKARRTESVESTQT